MTRKPLAGAELDRLVAGLNKLCRNLWWSWDQEAQDLFQELSPRAWQNLYHNAAAILREVSEYELRMRLEDAHFEQRARAVLHDFETYLACNNTWGQVNAPQLLQNPVAYFSAEFGFHESLPISAGGLGILAGDHAKSASDLGLGFVGVGLFYREGYFQQAIDSNNWQTEFYNLVDPKNVPLEPVLDANGQPLVGDVEIDMNRVFFQAWRVNVGRVPVYLLDANRPENAQHFRDLTSRVYGGDNTMRVMQEMLLGIGGVRLLRKLGVQPSVFHMNEGHAAFLTVELIREKLVAGQKFSDALAATKAQCIFTTHTPVEAGHDRFPTELMDFAFMLYQHQLPVPFQDILPLGRVHPENAQEPFCMTVLALKVSRAANGVSELHGDVSRHMWQCLYPGTPVEKVPIGHITNGIHMLGWMKGSVRQFWREKMKDKKEGVVRMWNEKYGHDWASAIHHPEFWEKMADPSFVSDEELWALRYKLRREMIEFIRRRLLHQTQRIAPGDYIRFEHLLNVDALTIGFARRFATYKRAPLIFQQFDNIVKLVKDKQRPVQFIFAGKAHPRDDEGKRFIQQIIHLSKGELVGSVVFVENYDVHIARQMVSGCDVWLNNPRRPLEASGTSGMKAGCNGCLNFSILDGWWREGYDGTNGFAIGGDSNPNNVEEQDRVDSANLYQTLTEQVIPMFFDRDEQGIPRQWIQRIRRAMVTLVSQFTTDRMVKEYTRKYYLTK